MTFRIMIVSVTAFRAGAIESELGAAMKAEHYVDLQSKRLCDPTSMVVGSAVDLCLREWLQHWRAFVLPWQRNRNPVGVGYCFVCLPRVARCSQLLGFDPQSRWDWGFRNATHCFEDLAFLKRSFASGLDFFPTSASHSSQLRFCCGTHVPLSPGISTSGPGSLDFGPSRSRSRGNFGDRCCAHFS